MPHPVSERHTAGLSVMQFVQNTNAQKWDCKQDTSACVEALGGQTQCRPSAYLCYSHVFAVRAEAETLVCMFGPCYVYEGFGSQ